MQTDGPLSGYRVIELGQLLAGPFAGCMLGYFCLLYTSDAADE